jgi:hypothetical protein
MPEMATFTLCWVAPLQEGGVDCQSVFNRGSLVATNGIKYQRKVCLR